MPYTNRAGAGRPRRTVEATTASLTDAPKSMNADAVFCEHMHAWDFVYHENWPYLALIYGAQREEWIAHKRATRRLRELERLARSLSDASRERVYSACLEHRVLTQPLTVVKQG